MLIRQLQLSNYRGFKDLELELFDGINLLIGTNGSGKTSLLDAITVIQAAFFAQDPVLKRNIRRSIDYTDVRIGENNLRALSASVGAALFTATDSPIDFKRTASIKADGKKSISPTTLETKPLSAYGQSLLSRMDEGKWVELPLIAYYASQRLHKSANKSQNQSYDPSLGSRLGYMLCLDEQSIYPLINNWLGDAVFNRFEQSSKAIQNPNNILQNIEAAIALLLLDVLELPSHFQLWQQKINGEIFTTLQINNGIAIPLEHYSDGWRNLLYLVIDMVWRASHLKPDASFNELQRNTTGIVLIDEIDLHIHVKWQMKLTKFLQSLFPNVQFVITTHSPSVIAGFVRRELNPNGESKTEEKSFKDGIFLLDGFNVKKLEAFDGMSIEHVIANVLGGPVRIEKAQVLIEKLKALLEANDIKAIQKQNEASQLLEQLAQVASVYDPAYIDLSIETQLLEFVHNGKES